MEAWVPSQVLKNKACHRRGSRNQQLSMKHSLVPMVKRLDPNEILRYNPLQVETPRPPLKIKLVRKADQENQMAVPVLRISLAAAACAKAGFFFEREMRKSKIICGNPNRQL